MVESSKLVEIWGGLECTVNRVHDTYLDQLNFAGHYKRNNDIELLAALGIKKLRYPVIWEKHQPKPDTEIHWKDTERRLNKIRELGIEPIAGLVHHGSGPAYASIQTDDFAPALAAYAEKVALRFPWIKYYTPINEPLTTARFCGLYGHWYPHEKQDKAFLTMLINECKATVLAMQAVRKVNPEACLVQTEDLSKTYSTALLRYQAEFENKRRWLGFDLMMGKVNQSHPLWTYLLKQGIQPADLEFFYRQNCTPDIIGFNYYPTSERFLDENLDKYPDCAHGGNGKHQYADVEAVRVDLDEYGAELILNEAWQRFNLPMAITEVHLGCTRDEQLRWFNEMHAIACGLNKKGVDIVAVTAWAMMGSYGWNTLLTNSKKAVYEPGVFDLRSKNPRPTALAGLVKALASGQTLRHPVLQEKGWWKKDIRVLYFQNNIRSIKQDVKSSQPILIIGKTGTLGQAFARICTLRGLHYELVGRSDLNLGDKEQINTFIALKKPWAVINAAGFVRVDDAENCSKDCYIANTDGPVNLAVAAKKFGFKLLTFSSDLVFNGRKNAGYIESDTVSPLNVYGRSKAQAEKRVLEKDPSALIVRTSAFFGPWDSYNFVNNVLSSLKSGAPFTAVNDARISPTYVPDLVHASLDLLLDNEFGIWHLANQGETTWAGLASDVAKLGGCDPSLIIPVACSTLNFAAERPLYSVLSSEKGLFLPKLDDALFRYFNEQELIDLSVAAVETA